MTLKYLKRTDWYIKYSYILSRRFTTHKGTPSGRRRFLDMEISQTSATYYHQLMQYNRLLQQRKCDPKEYRGKQNIPLEEWDLQLADMASFIVKKRLESLKKINLPHRFDEP